MLFLCPRPLSWLRAPCCRKQLKDKNLSLNFSVWVTFTWQWKPAFCKQTPKVTNSLSFFSPPPSCSTFLLQFFKEIFPEERFLFINLNIICLMQSYTLEITYVTFQWQENYVSFKYGLQNRAKWDAGKTGGIRVCQEVSVWYNSGTGHCEIALLWSFHYLFVYLHSWFSCP